MNFTPPIQNDLDINEPLERFLADILEKRDVTNVTRMHDTLEILIKYNNIPVNLSIKIISIYWKLSMEADFALPSKENEDLYYTTDENGFPVGLISTNTLLTHSDYFTKGSTRSRDYLIPINGEKLTVNDLLTDELLTINEEEDLVVAANKMIKNKIGGIPVVDSNNNLVGIISKTDVVRALSIIKPHEKLKLKYRELY